MSECNSELAERRDRLNDMPEQHATKPRRSTSALREWSAFDSRSLRRWLVLAIGGQQRFSRAAKIGVSLLLFLVAFSIRSIQAVDVQPLMYTPDEPARGMSEQYDHEAGMIDGGRRILVPADWDPSDTSLLVHAPGYPMFLAGIYAVSDRSYFYAQLFQNAINSLSPVIIFLLAGELISWRIGAVSGLIAAVSHHLSYYSNMILPDSLCALPILLALYVLVKARHRRKKLAMYVLSGLMIGLSIWLRPNALLMGPFIALMMVVIANRRSVEIRRAWLLAIVPILAITPITVRNYLLFHKLVLVSANTGIVMLEGVANASRGKFGPLPGDDKQVGEMESVWYNDPRYMRDWSEPDGIQRDRDRVKRSAAIIIRHPIWFLGSMIGRMEDMLSYVADADLVLRKAPPGPTFSADGEIDLPIDPSSRRIHPRRNFVANQATLDFCMAFGRKMNWARPGARLLQRITKETDEVLLFLGLPVLFFLSVRRAAWLAIVPLYYLLIQSAVHTEFRYTLPMHYFLFVFAATVWVLIGWVLKSGIMRAVNRLAALRHTTKERR
jgi:hypothetical protein